MARAKKIRLFGEEFMDAERKLFSRLPKQYHVDVRDALNKLQLWDMIVFLNVQGEAIKTAERLRRQEAK